MKYTKRKHPKNLEELKKIWGEARNRATEILKSKGIEYPRNGFSIGPGWEPIVFETLDKMLAAGWCGELNQVKQKFCQLRLYYDQPGGYPEDHPEREKFLKIKEIVEAAERICDKICEWCGKPHNLKIPNVGVALCKECEKNEEN